MGQMKYSQEQLLDMLRACHEEHGSCTPRLFNSMDTSCSASTINKRFGWLNAKRMAGLEDALSNTGRNKKYTNDEILEDLQRCADRNDGRCTVSLLKDEDDLVTASVAIERFGSWTEAKIAAGVAEDGRSDNHRPREYTDEEYLELLRECKRKHGKVTQKKFNEESDADEHPTAAAVRKRFDDPNSDQGGWNLAKEAANIDAEDDVEATPTFSDEEIIEMLRECKDRHGKVTIGVFAGDDDFCSPETAQRRFDDPDSDLGGWSRAKEIAGV